MVEDCQRRKDKTKTQHREHRGRSTEVTEKKQDALKRAPIRIWDDQDHRCRGEMGAKRESVKPR